MAVTIHKGAIGPFTFSYTLTPGASGWDLATASTGVFFVRRPDGVETTWAAAVSGVSSSSAKLTHTFEALDVDVLGSYLIYPTLVIAAGKILGSVVELTVFDPFGG